MSHLGRARSNLVFLVVVVLCAVNLLVAFDSPEREAAFRTKFEARLRGHGESGFALRMLLREG